MGRKRIRPGSLCLQRNCFRRQLDVELMFGTIALAGKPSTGAVLTLRLAFVTLLLAPPTRTNEGRVSVKTRVLELCSLTGNLSLFFARISVAQAPFCRSSSRPASLILGRFACLCPFADYHYLRHGRALGRGRGHCASWAYASLVAKRPLAATLSGQDSAVVGANL